MQVYRTFQKLLGEQDEFIQMAPFTGKFILLLTASQQHSECLQISQLLPRGAFQSVNSGNASSAAFQHGLQCSRLSATPGCWEPQLLHPNLGQELPWLQCLANRAGAIKEKEICVQVSLLFGNCLSGSAAR